MGRIAGLERVVQPRSDDQALTSGPMFLLRRLLNVLVVVIVSTALGFVVLHLVPGDPLGMATEQAGRSADVREQMKVRYGLDKPVAQQLVSFAKRAITGDWGNSLVSGRPVGAALTEALRNTLKLSGSGLLLAIAIGLLVGGWQGWKPHSRTGRFVGSALTALYVIPEFIIAILLITVFAYHLSLFPIGGAIDPVLSVVGSKSEQVRNQLWHLVLPAVTLGLGWGAAIARQQRNSLAETRGDDFVRTARAKGVTANGVFFRHAFPVALPPVVTVVGLMLPVLVGGAVVVETVFAWPGLGSLLLKAISARDYPLVSAAIVLTGVVVACGSLLTDAVLFAINPRLRASAE